MKRLVFFGAGNISQAIIGGLIDGGYSKDNIAYVDRNKSNSLKLKKQQVKNTQPRMQNPLIFLY